MEDLGILKSLRVLFLCEWYPNRNEAFKGLFIHNHAKAVADYCKVTVVYAGADPNLTSNKYEVENIVENNLRIIRVYYKNSDAGNNFFGRTIRVIRYFNALYKGLRIYQAENGSPHLIHVNIVGRAGIAAWILKKLKKIPYIVTEHWTGYLPQSGKFKGFLKKYLARLVIEKASAVTTVSDNLKNCMLAHNLNGNYEIVPNVVNTNINVKKKYDDKIIALNISDLVDEMKNISGIIKAVKEIILSIPDFEFHIVGEGPDKAKLEKLATDLNLLNKSVFFFDYMPNKSIYEKIASSSFLIINSRYETFSVVAAEALACGVPVLTTRCGGPEEFINSKFGMVIEPDNHDQLIEGIKWMTENYKSFDEEKLQLYAKTKFSKEIIAEKFFGIYQKEMKNTNNWKMND